MEPVTLAEEPARIVKTGVRVTRIWFSPACTDYFGKGRDILLRAYRPIVGNAIVRCRCFCQGRKESFTNGSWRTSPSSTDQPWWRYVAATRQKATFLLREEGTFLKSFDSP